MFTSIFFICAQWSPVGVYVPKKQSKFHQQSNRQKAQDQRSVRMDHTLKWDRVGKALVMCLPHSGTVHWHALDRKQGGAGGGDGSVFSFRQCSLNGVHLSPPACLPGRGFSLELPKGKVYIWQNEREREIVHFHTEGWKSRAEFPSSDSSIRVAVFPLERQLFIKSDCAAARSWKPVSFLSL